MVTREQLLERFEYSETLGRLIYRVSVRHIHKGSIAGSNYKNGYRAIHVNGRDYLEHRLIWLYLHGAWPNQIDHINGDKTDNRITNLRSVSHTDNMRNRPRYKSNTSGVTGVHWREDRKCWRAMLGHKRLGHFKTKVEATLARKHAEEELGYHKNHGRTP